MLTRPRAVQASLAAALVVVVLGGLEAAGRRVPRLMPVQWQVVQFAVAYPFHVLPDPELGFSMPPNQREEIRTSDYTFLFETDSKGYPNREPWPQNPTLVFLGDSLIIGSGVGVEDSFTGLLARMLPDQSLVNLGLAAAGPERQARIYRRFGGNWHPDVVVSSLFLASDVENDRHFLSWLQEGRGADYNTYRLRLARRERDRGLVQRALDNSLVLDRTLRPVLRWIEGGDHRDDTRFRFADGSETLFERHALAFAATPAAADDPRLDTFLRSVERLQSLVEQSGARFLVMLIPSKEELFGAEMSRTRMNLASRIKDRLAAMPVAVLDLYPAIRRRAAERPAYYRLDIHLNAYGNRIVAEEFAAWFEQHQRTAP